MKTRFNFILVILSTWLAPLSSEGRLLSDDWYTITVSAGQKKVHYGYYHDRIELKKEKIFYQSNVWKLEENYINEEQLGGLAENSPELKPVFFHFHSKYRTTETSIDGTITDGKMLTVKIKKAGADLPLVKKSIPPKTILSVFFPYWLRNHLEQLKPGKSIYFRTIPEDNIEESFSSLSGSVREEKPDTVTETIRGRKFLVEYRDLRSFWWLDSQGVLVRMEMPEQKMLIEKVTQKQAESFLKLKTPSELEKIDP